MRDAIDTVRQYREAVGDDVDLCIEIHRRLTPHEAIVLARGIEQFHPFFYEDPILPDNFDMMGLVAENIHIPIATGERLHTIYEFEMLLARNAVQYVRPDVCMCGGITGAKKIAALAEARHVGVVPHNPLSPVSTAACIQIAAAVPNFALQEYPDRRGRAAEERDRQVVDGPRRQGISDHPGRAGHRDRAGPGRRREAPVPDALGWHPPARRRLGGGPVEGTGDRGQERGSPKTIPYPLSPIPSNRSSIVRITTVRRGTMRRGTGQSGAAGDRDGRS